MYALPARGITGFVCLCASLVVACGSTVDGKFTPANNTGGFGNFGAAPPFGTGGFIATGGVSGVASFVGQGGIPASGGVPATGGIPAMNTGGVIDPGPPPTGQILDCRGTGPCRIDDGDACCIGATTDSSGNVVSISENCIPPNASCNYPFSLAHCDGPEDCRQSDVCCGTLKPFGNVQLFGDVSCQPASQCPANGKYVVCRPGITQCPVGTTCGTFPTLPSDITVCR